MVFCPSCLWSESGHNSEKNQTWYGYKHSVEDGTVSLLRRPWRDRCTVALLTETEYVFCAAMEPSSDAVARSVSLVDLAGLQLDRNVCPVYLRVCENSLETCWKERHICLNSTETLLYPLYLGGQYEAEATLDHLLDEFAHLSEKKFSFACGATFHEVQRCISAFTSSDVKRLQKI